MREITLAEALEEIETIIASEVTDNRTEAKVPLDDLEAWRWAIIRRLQDNRGNGSTERS
jgi:hypothetical protein